MMGWHRVVPHKKSPFFCYQSAIILVICSHQWWRNDKEFADFIKRPNPAKSFLQVQLSKNAKWAPFQAEKRSFLQVSYFIASSTATATAGKDELLRKVDDSKMISTVSSIILHWQSHSGTLVLPAATYFSPMIAKWKFLFSWYKRWLP